MRDVARRESCWHPLNSDTVRFEPLSGCFEGLPIGNRATPPHRIDDHEIDERQCHEHELWPWQECVNPQPDYQLIYRDECQGSHPWLTYKTPQEVVDQSAQCTGDGPREQNGQSPLDR